jgi:oxygen-dependent protoporphyrinogen oxidase
MERGPSVQADGVIIAGPSKHAGRLLANVDAELSRQLSAVGYASSAVVHLAYKRSQIAHPLNAFGCVVPVTEGRQIIAASFSSIKYEGRAPAGYVLLRAFMGGALQSEIVSQTDQDLTKTAIQDLDALLGISTPPQFAIVSRWPDSMAQYDVGHLGRVAVMREKIHRHKGLELAGNGFDGVGIPDCVRAGEKAAENLVSELMIQRSHADAPSPKECPFP